MTDIRQRRKTDSAAKSHSSDHIALLSKIDSRRRCSVLSTSLCVITCAVIAVLAYANAASPITAVALHDTHDAAGMKWNREYNTDLQKGQKLFGELIGPESIAVDDEHWYTGLKDGRLIKISNVGKSTVKVRDIGKEVNYTANAGRSMKRPLGMRIFQEKLYFADSYQGIFAMDLKSLSWKKIIGFNEVSPPMRFANDLTISTEGVIYFTDACARWTYKDAVYSVAEGQCTGRVFKVELDGKNPQLLKDKLCLPNGIELTPNETKLVVSESRRRRIIVIDANSGDTEKTTLLHGGGDNIRRSSTGGYWVPISVIALPVDQFLDRCPLARNIMMTFLDEATLEKIAAKIGLRQGTILKLNEEFEIEQIHQDLEGKVAWGISHVEEYEPGKLILGSFGASGIVTLNIPLTDKWVNQ